MIPQDQLDAERERAIQQTQPQPTEQEQEQEQEQGQGQELQTTLPNIKQSTLLILALLDDVIQRNNLNLQVQVQAISQLTSSVKTLADILERPDRAERVMNMITRTNPQMLQQVGQIGQPRTDATTPFTNADLQPSNQIGMTEGTAMIGNDM